MDLDRQRYSGQSQRRWNDSRPRDNDHSGWEGVDFCSGPFAGPAWAGVKMQSMEGAAASFAGTVDGIRHSLQYRIEGSRLAVLAGLRNERLSDYSPKAAQLVLGINCEMLSYPKWNDRYFPTLLRCEKTHFWGYFMTPHGRIMTVGSPDPVASYTMNYETIELGRRGPPDIYMQPGPDACLASAATPSAESGLAESR